MQFFTTWIWAAGPIWLNLQALAMKGDFTWMPIAVMIGAGAGVGCYMVAMLRHPIWRITAAACAILAASYNVPTAIGSSSEHRRAATEPNRERIEHRESLLRRDALLADKIAKIGWRMNGDTSYSIRAGIEQLKTLPHYIASDGCRDLKKRDPGGICSKLIGEQGRLSEAAQVEAFETERETIRQDLLKVEAPATADIQLATLMQLIAPFYQVDGDQLSAILSSIGPIVLELLGTFMPAVMGRFWAERNESATRAAIEMLDTLPDTQSDWDSHNLENSLQEADILLQNGVQIGESVRQFSEKMIEDHDGEHILCRPVYSAYRKWCDLLHLDPVKETDFIAQMGSCGYIRGLQNRRMHYFDIRVKSVQLTVVK